jgi:hypothetical protein
MLRPFGTIFKREEVEGASFTIAVGFSTITYIDDAGKRCPCIYLNKH